MLLAGIAGTGTLWLVAANSCGRGRGVDVQKNTYSRSFDGTLSQHSRVIYLDLCISNQSDLRD